MTQTELFARAFLSSRLRIEELQGQAELLLSREDLPQVLEGPTIDAVKFVDKLHQVYLIVGVQEKRFLDLFGNFHRAIKQLPDSVSLSVGLEKSDTIPMTQEGFMDAWPGRYQSAYVTFKVPRVRSTQNLEEVKEILRERASTWKKLDHPNIAVFHGVTHDLFPVGLVYGGEENGNILRYVSSHPESPLLPLLLQVAEGLQYLHSLGFTHGTLRPGNVLASCSGHIRLTDYGLAPLNANPNLTAALPGVGNVGWLAPEIIDLPSSAANAITESMPADIFAFGILGMEVFTGQPPFGDSSDLVVSLQILNRVRPEFPPNAEAMGLTTEVRELLQRCWAHSPARRMTIDEVVTLCKGLLGNVHSQPTPPPGELARQLTRPVARKENKWWRCSCGLW